MPLDNCAVYILNSVGKPVEPGQIGEIFASGAHVTSERYMTNKDLNSVGGYSSNNTDINKKGIPTLYFNTSYRKIQTKGCIHLKVIRPYTGQGTLEGF